MGNIIEVITLKLLLMFFIAYSGGLLVEKLNVRVNYTRKINHLFLFFVPALIDNYWLAKDASGLALSLNEVVFAFAAFIIFIKPVRDRVSSIATAFSSFDRPEDRPYTLLWFVSQTLVGYVVMMPLIYLYIRYDMLNLLNIQILVGVFGDGLAEPIGIKFGRHPYAVYSLFARRKYVRTLQGTAAIFIVSIIVVCLFKNTFTPNQFIVALFSIPPIMTIAEAISPHTWDDPLMTISGSLLVFYIKVFI
jgi:dolichol kinase